MDDTNTTPKPEAPQESPETTPAPPAPAPAAPEPVTPITQWPGAFGVFKPSRSAVRRNLTTVVMLIVLSLAAGVIVGLIFGKVQWLNELVSLLVGAVFSGAQVLVFVGAARGRQVELSDSINQALPMFFKMFLLNLLVAASIVGGLILFIVPAFFIIPRLILAPYFLMDKKMGVIEAYAASWNQTKGNVGKVWGVIGVTLLMLLPVITIIGIIASVYFLVMYACAVALLYQFVLDHPAAKVEAAEPEPAAAPPAPAAN